MTQQEQIFVIEEYVQLWEIGLMNAEDAMFAIHVMLELTEK